MKAAQCIGLEGLLLVSEPRNSAVLYGMGNPIHKFIKNHLKTTYVSCVPTEKLLHHF